jgi:hypothetical protein
MTDDATLASFFLFIVPSFLAAQARTTLYALF